MRFSNYREDTLYLRQPNIDFPLSGEQGRQGFNVVVFSLGPNVDESITSLSAPMYDFVSCRIKDYLIDGKYQDKFGQKSILLTEKVKYDKKFSEDSNFKFNYISQARQKNITDIGRSCIYDYSRWLQLFFGEISSLPTRKKCSEFIRLLEKGLTNPIFSTYKKVLLIDMVSWVRLLDECVIMNSQLLNNPLSILMYTAYHYPELLSTLKGIQLMLTTRSDGKLLLLDIGTLNKEKYSKLKSKLTKFYGTIISAEDTGGETSTQEKNAEKREQIKEEIKGLVSDKTEPGTFNLFDDITTSVSDDIPELKELDKLMEEKEDDSLEDDSPDENYIPDIDPDDIVNTATDDALANLEEEELDDIDPEKVAEDIANQIKTGVYKSSFTPTRTEKEKAKLERLLKGQEDIIHGTTLEDVNRKSISTSPLGSYINSTNSTIQTSKFVNFDREYVEKCMEKDIDEAVGILAQADHKIFITSKEVVDSSTPLDLKKTYIYKLEDEKGNKTTLKFDIPVVLDGKHVFLNGTKKNILHQFILKPIVKTGPDTVQIVTANNKVFIRRMGFISQNSDKVVTYLQKNKETHSTVTGNCSMKNVNHEVPLDFSTVSKYFSSYKIGEVTYYMIMDNSLNAYERAHGKVFTYDATKVYPIGFNNKTKEVITLEYGTSYIDYIFSLFDESTQSKITKIKKKPKLLIAKAKILSKDIPLILFMLFCEGFSTVMRKANIKHMFVKKEELRQYSTMQWDTIPLADGYIVWDKTEFRNELLMNGLKASDLTSYNYEDLEVKETYISLFIPYYSGNNKFHNTLDNYKNFLIDKKTESILADFGYPTDLVSVLVVAAGMLTDIDFLPENNLKNMRIRSAEVISELVYMAITQQAYPPYRNTAYKKKPTKISLKQSAIIDKLLSSDTNMIEEFSSLNPALELEKSRAVTFKGVHGIQMDRAMTLPRRAYDRSMLGTVGITTSPDAKVGVVRQLTLEPKITSTYGYIDVDETEEMNDLNAANLFTTSELLQPLGIIHDDPDRSAMKGLSRLNHVNCGDALLSLTY